MEALLSSKPSVITRATRPNIPEDGGATFLQTVGSYKSHTASHPRRRRSA
jgi:hypothetical protein